LVVREEHGYPAFVLGESGTKDYNLIAELYNPEGNQITATIEGSYENIIGAPFVYEAKTTITWGGENNTSRQVNLHKYYPVAWSYN
jgi:hypothetical protein